MTETHETTADVIAEMREIRVREIQDYADRLEAAHRRERGNMAAMREALEVIDKNTDLLDIAEDIAPKLHPSHSFVAVQIRKIVRAALATPPRNCDKYATYNDAMQAFDAFVREQGKLGFINLYTESFKWLFAHATEKEGDNDGR